MPDVYAVCDTCGTFFPAYVVEFGDAPEIELTDATVTVGPDLHVPGNCPECGGTGHMLAGVFNVVGDTLELLQGPESTVSELQRLAQVLRDARERNASVEEVKETIREETSQLATLADLLPTTRGELYAFIALLLTLIQMLVHTASVKGTNIQDVNVDINQLIGITIEQQTPQPKPHLRLQQVPKVGRNDLCPCGSGKKYKRCHGDPARARQNSPPR
jgi:SEC-C motif